jgi:autophagy-related protein 5
MSFSPSRPVPGRQSHPDTSATEFAKSIPSTLWELHVPLFVSHSSHPDSTPCVVSVPRFGYLALLLPRISAFFGTDCSSFHYEGIQLRNLAVGLLVDLYQPQLPWRLTVADGPSWDIGDTFMNSAKEVRNAALSWWGFRD